MYVHLFSFSTDFEGLSNPAHSCWCCTVKHQCHAVKLLNEIVKGFLETLHISNVGHLSNTASYFLTFKYQSQITDDQKYDYFTYGLTYQLQ